MMITIINEFRQVNGKHPVSSWIKPLNDYCELHSLEMAKRGCHFHSEERYRHYLGEVLGEIVVMQQFIHNFETTIRQAIYKVIGESKEGHREALLNWKLVCYGYCIDKGILYLTIRGC